MEEMRHLEQENLKLLLLNTKNILLRTSQSPGNGERILRDTAGDLYRGAALQGLRDHPAPQPSQRGPGTQPGRLPLHRTGPGSRESCGSPAFRPYHYRR